MTTLFEIAGLVTVSLAGLLLCLFVFGLSSVLISRRRENVLLPRLTLVSLKFFYSPLCSVLGLWGASTAVDDVLVRTVNGLMATRFRKAGPRRMIFLPQCLRAPSCKARLDSRRGYICNQCGACCVGPISSAAEENDYEIFLVPGDSFVKRIIKQESPDAVIGVACHEELSMAMLGAASMGVVCSGVLLDKCGCFCTTVDVEKVLAILNGEECCNSSDK